MFAGAYIMAYLRNDIRVIEDWSDRRLIAETVKQKRNYQNYRESDTIKYRITNKIKYCIRVMIVRKHKNWDFLCEKCGLRQILKIEGVHSCAKFHISLELGVFKLREKIKWCWLLNKTLRLENKGSQNV